MNSRDPGGRPLQARRAPGFWTSAGRIFELSIRAMLHSRRTIFMTLIAGAPVLLALAASVLGAGGVATFRVNGADVSGEDVYGLAVRILFLRFTVPVLGVFYGTSLIADEVEERTITYLFTRPIQRGAVLTGKYLAYLACATVVVLTSVTLLYFLLVPLAEVLANFGELVTDLGILTLGLAAYGALFALMGAVLKRPLLVGLFFAFGWEQIALIVPGYLRHFTIAYHLQALIPRAVPSDEAVSLLSRVLDAAPSALTSVAWLLTAVVVCLGLAVRVVERREYVLEQ